MSSSSQQNPQPVQRQRGPNRRLQHVWSTGWEHLGPDEHSYRLRFSRLRALFTQLLCYLRLKRLWDRAHRSIRPYIRRRLFGRLRHLIYRSDHLATTIHGRIQHTSYQRELRFLDSARSLLLNSWASWQPEYQRHIEGLLVPIQLPDPWSRADEDTWDQDYFDRIQQIREYPWSRAGQEIVTAEPWNA